MILGASPLRGSNSSSLITVSVIWPLAESEPTSVGPNQGVAFNTVNLNKKGVTLDLSKPEGVQLALDLARNCDVVVDNMRPGAMAKMGLGHDDFRKVNDNIIGASSSGRGCEGPERNYLAEDAKRMIDETNCDYVMIGRGAMGNPFLFEQINDYLSTGSYNDYSFKNRLDSFFEYLFLTKQYKIKFANIKGQAMRFTKGITGGSKLRFKITLSKNIDELEKIMKDAYQ